MPKKRTVRCLSIQQPYADQIIFGDKWAENRSWRTKHRGELFIHASKWSPGGRRETPGNGDAGAIIGKVNLVDCVDHWEVTNPLYRHLHGDKKRREFPEELEAMRDLAEAEGWTRESFRHACGDLCFVLAEREPLAEPIPAKGKLNVWTFEI